ncbi:cytochrome o ubiquinol oxidase subunit IV [Candidatus Saccharibacteria bacterium]|nr:cytochrome o ubiquinol oxidase subunit IV [Candidatus Saccharibacteria bacterium]MBI3338043.1 cytochrome o ubiquinol oxidase subunit IV [Candidatus Saccharibacteria bacterium]
MSSRSSKPYKINLPKTPSSPDRILSAANSFSSVDATRATSPSDKTVFARDNSLWERMILGKSSLIGYIASIVLTSLAYWLVNHHVLSAHTFGTHGVIKAAIIFLAIIQLFVQLIFFLNLGQESKPRWNLMAFLFAGLVVIVLVFGSLWIMNNLNYRQMSPDETEKFIQKEEGIYRH